MINGNLKKNNMKINKGTFYLDDCMNFMKDIEDNYYDLAIVDPPIAK